MTLRLVPFLVLLITANLLMAQKEANHWYFKAGLDFSAGQPVPDNNGRVTFVGEGVATMSDHNGNLLFYTLRGASDFDTIFNKLHQPMANGDGIFGNGSSVQSSLIIKKPGSANLYYLFSQSGIGSNSTPNGLYYNIIDMNLASGNGSVTAKNLAVYTHTSWGQAECMAGVRHCNGIDYWILTRDNQQSNRFRAFLVNSSGVSTNAVVSTVGPSNNSHQSQLKFSPSGRRVALTVFGQNGARLFDFDPSTGTLSNPIVLNAWSIYVEFSPDGSKLYGTGADSQNYNLCQWDLCAGSSNLAILNSIYTQSLSPVSGNWNFGNLQTGPDGKIYIATLSFPATYSICVIANPNNSGAACNFIFSGQSIGNRVCTWALPNFVSSYFRTLPSVFTHTSGSCTTVNFTAPAFATVNCTALNPYTGLSWNFNDPASGTNNTSNASSPSHTFSSPGTYTVKLALLNSCYADTLYKVVTVVPTNTLQASPNSTICVKDKIILTSGGASTYSWSNGATSSSIALTPATSTVVVVTATLSDGCVASKSISITTKVCTGIDSESLSSFANMYPVPAVDRLVVESEIFSKIILFDLCGKIVLQQSIFAGKNELDISELQSGLYLASFSAGAKHFTKKLVIEARE